ncbi:uncharacterized protein PG998_003735 [Apiospora kogelbergensis]|uniref:Integral membrane protein n=1 Tax=Apiospora kogelbergensis TaxID=1337665 RepID=A0AAW0QNY8_9PEZI
MNASQAHRASYRASFYAPPPQRQISRAGRAKNPPRPADGLSRKPSVATSTRSEPVEIVDWEGYKAQKDELETVHEVTEVPSLGDDPPDFLDQAFRMFSVYPVRDLNWVNAVVFVVGSVIFTIGAVFQLLPAVDPTTPLFPNQLEFAVPFCTLLGAAMFLTAGILSLIASFNTDRGEFKIHIRDPKYYERKYKDMGLDHGVRDENGDIEKLSGSKLERIGTNSSVSSTNSWNIGEKIYRPALIGDPNWVWWPPSGTFSRTFRTLPFQLGLMQLLGGMILSISVAPGFPGVLSMDDPLAPVIFVFTPLCAGSSFFVIANAVLLITCQDHWYKPALTSAPWQGAFWSLLGAIGFFGTGLFLFLANPVDSSWSNFLGSVAFLIGAIVQWYDLMAFHPDDWAA